MREPNSCSVCKNRTINYNGKNYCIKLKTEIVNIFEPIYRCNFFSYGDDGINPDK
jgi:hypothetical protein